MLSGEKEEMVYDRKLGTVISWIESSLPRTWGNPITREAVWGGTPYTFANGFHQIQYVFGRSWHRRGQNIALHLSPTSQG